MSAPIRLDHEKREREMKPNCKTCKHCFDPYNSDECRRYPPRIFRSKGIDGQRFDSYYPKAIGGCGEYEELKSFDESSFGVDARTLEEIVSDLKKEAATNGDCETTALKLGMSPGYFSRLINRKAIPSPNLLESLGYEIRYFKRK